MKVGFFGKLPGYGDFIQRNVSPSLIDKFDLWIIQSIESSSGQLRDNWRQQYFNSPIWRFVISKGLVSENTITGFMMPSVDRTGRCYPLTLICETNQEVNPFILARKTDSMHQHAEEFFLSLLEQHKPALDDINRVIGELYLSAKEPLYVSAELNRPSTAMELCSVIDPNISDISSSNETFLHYLLTTQNVKISSWWTVGGVGVNPRKRYFSGMPPVDSFISFLLGAAN